MPPVLRPHRGLRRIALAISVLALLLSAQPAAATEYSPPWADIFGSSWTNLDTTESAGRLYDQLAGTGYARYKDLNKSAHIAMGTAYAQSDAIWVTFGHANKGTITYCNTPTCDTNTYSWLYANSSVGSCGGGSNDCLANYPSSLDDIKLMVFAGCHTGQDGAPGSLRNGNLVDLAALYDHVDDVFGFTALVYWPMGNDYATFLGTELAAGSTVDYAVWKAGVEVKNRWLDPWGWDTYYGHWRTNDKILPASYGLTGWPS